MKDFKKPVKAGYKVLVIDLGSRSPTAELEDAVNDALDQLTGRSYSAGFKCRIVSVGIGKKKTTILYKLSDDPSFHPPM